MNSLKDLLGNQYEHAFSGRNNIALLRVEPAG